MCMSYIIINPWPSWIEIYEYFDEFINLCTSIDAWCIFVSIKQRYETFESYDHDWCFPNVGVKKLYSRFVWLHENYVSFLIEELMVFKLQLFSIYSFLHILLDPHKIFHVEEANKNSSIFCSNAG